MVPPRMVHANMVVQCASDWRNLAPSSNAIRGSDTCFRQPAALIVMSLVDGLTVPDPSQHPDGHLLAHPEKKGRAFAMTSILRWLVTGTTFTRALGSRQMQAIQISIGVPRGFSSPTREQADLWWPKHIQPCSTFAVSVIHVEVDMGWACSAILVALCLCSRRTSCSCFCEIHVSHSTFGTSVAGHSQRNWRHRILLQPNRIRVVLWMPGRLSVRTRCHEVALEQR